MMNTCLMQNVNYKVQIDVFGKVHSVSNHSKKHGILLLLETYPNRCGAIPTMPSMFAATG